VSVAFEFPEFTQPVELPDGRSWTACYDSYDQRHDVAYYVVTIAGRRADPVVAEVWMWPAGEDWTTPGFAGWLRDQVHAIAVTGASNTPYRPS